MADKHPYTSGSGSITQVVNQLRRAFPSPFTAETLKKLSIAPNNESYVLNILKFIGILDGEGKKVSTAASVFNKHDRMEFQQGFAELVKTAYNELFELHGDDAWTLDSNKLISFFRTHDETSDVVGRRQASTFQALARISGKLAEDVTPASPPRASKPSANPKRTKKTLASTTNDIETAVTSNANLITPQPVGSAGHPTGDQWNNGVALTVRIEINLPAAGEQSTYDAIFKSIRENLMNGNCV